MKINYTYYNYGPLIVHSKVDLNTLNQVKKLCSKKNKKANYKLVGVIENEHDLDIPKYESIMKPYVETYHQAYKHWTSGKNLNGYFKILDVWVNYMKANEYNPPHIHPNCDLSTVLFVQVPDKLKQENEKWKVKTGNTFGGPGLIGLTTLLSGKFYNGGTDFFPEEGDFLMFPSDVTHYVNPFKSKCERISVAVNYKLIQN